MSTRSMQFFMTRSECESTLRDITRELSFHLVLVVPGNPEQIEVASSTGPFTMTSGKQADWVYLSKAPITGAQLQSSHTEPAVWGWVRCILPWEKETILYQADLACKTDYYRPETKTVHENPVSGDLYRRVVTLLKKKLPFQTYIGPEGGVLKPCRSVKHSQGAADWVHGGGQLKAWGQVAMYGIGNES
jgi:hypothetical protein